MLEDTPALRRKVRENRSRDDANTTLMKDFAGGVLVVSGANSAASLRSMPVRYLFLDEIDAYPQDVDGEGCPVVLAEKRTSTLPGAKVLKVSTPTAGTSARSRAVLSSPTPANTTCPARTAANAAAAMGTATSHGLRWKKIEDGLPIAAPSATSASTTDAKSKNTRSPPCWPPAAGCPPRQAPPGILTGAT
ncbi:MAG: phage terminase large subunit family protein [Comamonadaceae bacterium]|nr:phage terminase large subunit family protein [Comamonadaceae bacterium]